MCIRDRGRVRRLSPVLTALAQLSLPHLPSDREGSEINWFYGGGVWVAPAVALAGGRHAPLTASVSQFPLVWRAVRDPAFRAFAVGIHLSIGFLTVTARLLGDSGAHANAMFDRVAAERRDAAESEAAVASMREALGPAVDELEALEALLVACLLYTSDAADDLLCVDLGGRRIIKKKTALCDATHHHTSHTTH